MGVVGRGGLNAMPADTIDTAQAVSRRKLLTGVAGIGAVLAGCTDNERPPDPAGDQGGQGTGPHRRDGPSWLDGVDNYDGYVDWTGLTHVEIGVGAPGNGGHHAFAPAAVMVSPGTEIRWRWTGEGGTHDVIERTDRFRSRQTDRAGHTFSRTVERSDVIRYYCQRHRAEGMRGAILIR